MEMLIVGALIALFAGLAVFGAQRFYDDARRKAMYDEAKQIGTALSFARDDLGFFPRLFLLNLPKNLIYAYGNLTAVYPSCDTYGYYQSPGPAAAITQFWKGPYMPVSTARSSMAQGGKGLTWMRLPEADYSTFRNYQNDADPSLVLWPTDTWGNPYVVYEIVTDHLYVDSAANPKGMRMIGRPGETADCYMMVVSYGRNGVPGGFDLDTDPQRKTGYPGASLFVKGDLKTNNPLYFTLKSVHSQWPAANLEIPDLNNSNSKTFQSIIAKSIESGDPNNPGIVDKGSDDIFFRF